ncbi:hypothetical protein FNO01nite_05060 [Flavobacterium noncentrifugens]|uniref:Predicted ATPase n=1 Tax=Flavobacterium noncentrifugens TaxID=1128970 RepID=A0A1G8SHI5_9FLAO|nr:DUF3696 domain-containing protein [Flavobacterium noncentrifugens]GEP49834.1 hypothetical protein FNO01nite_05060 [Flavobacterium noncentrifugens]SDJ28688.1 Predicted ATPase [Flavobacterium noncentrifugens]
MISKINIQNFKSLENVEIACSNLNILTGLNGMGKSSVIQALLLLRQSFDKGTLTNEGLTLNGDLVEIGVASEALYKFALKEEISFTLSFQDQSSQAWTFIYREEENFTGSDIMPFAADLPIPQKLQLFSIFRYDTFKYLNAERLVKNEYPMSYSQVVRKKTLGKNGEFTAHFLEHFGPDEINTRLMYVGTDVNTLSYQISAWMADISPGIKVKTEKIPGANSIKLRYEFEGNGETTGEITPLNVGYGITYILPVLTALLCSKAGDILIIENPESHIHPKGQSIIGKLLVRTAELGVQIFVETHSDHLINGIRVAIKQDQNPGINTLSFFVRGKEKNKISTTLESPVIDADGRIDYWPEDFFDEWDNNLLELL